MKKHHHITLLLISFAWLIIFVGRITPSQLLLDIINSLQITEIEAGFALSGMWLSYGLMQFPGGSFSDKYGKKKTIILSLFCFSISSFLISLNLNAFTVFITFSFMGCASGLLPAPSFSIITEIFGPNKGKALGIHSSIGGLSGLAPMMLPFLLFLIGWRNIFLVWCFIGFVLLVSIYFFVNQKEHEKSKRSFSELLQLGIRSIKEKDTFFMFIANLIISFAWMGMLSWFPTYIQQVKNFSPEISGVLFAIMLSGSFVTKPIIGHLSDKKNRILIMMLLTVLAGISLFSITQFNNIILLGFCTFLFAQTSAFYPVRTSYMMDLWKDDAAATKFGVFRSLIILIGSPISAIIGFTKESFGFNTSLYILMIGLFLTSFMFLIRLLKNK